MSLDDLFSERTLANIHQDLYRNIASLGKSEDLFDDLSRNPANRNTEIATEMLAKSTAFASSKPIIDRPFEEAVWFDAIGFPFKNWVISHYSDGTYGIWYGASFIETTVYETIHHWTSSLLADAGFLQPGVIQERRVHLVQCAAALIDLRPSASTFPGLVSRNNYTFTRKLAHDCVMKDIQVSSQNQRDTMVMCMPF